MNLEEIIKLSEDELLDILPTLDLEFFDNRSYVIYPNEIREYLIEKTRTKKTN